MAVDQERVLWRRGKRSATAIRIVLKALRMPWSSIRLIADAVDGEEDDDGSVV